MLLTTDFTVRYRSGFVVSNIRLEMISGESIALVGESGSGKSTVVHSLLRLLPATATISGHITVDGVNLLAAKAEEMRAARRTIFGYVPQDASACLSPYRKIGEQLWTFWRARTGEGSREVFRKKCAQAFDTVALPPSVLELFPRQISIGQAQRVAIANATISQPSVIVADEPTSALDVITAAETVRFLGELKARGASLLLVTHDLGVAMALADRIVVLKAGAIVEKRTVEEFREGPTHPYSRQLLRAWSELSPRLEAREDNEEAMVAAGKL